MTITRRQLLAGAAGGLVLATLPRHAVAAPLLTETFSGSNTITGYPSGSVTGLDNPGSIWNDCAWDTSAVPYIDNTFPCPHGSPNSIVFRIDRGHLDAVHPWGIREWCCRWYMRLGDARSFSCNYTTSDGLNVTWAKMNRFWGQSWAWSIIMDTTEGGSGWYLFAEKPLSRLIFQGEGWTACKWYYNELHIKLNTPGRSDGIAEVRRRNVTDNRSLETFSASNINLTDSLTETFETLRIGGNAGAGGDTPPDAIVRYANIQLATTGWIGEAGAAAAGAAASPPPSPSNLIAN
jgi:hypothetical protein